MSLQRNFGLKVLALTLSVFLWAFVRFTQTPFASEISQADVDVPLEVLSDADKAVLDAPRSVRVTVRGSKEAVQNLQSNAIGARVDIHGKEDGVLFPSVIVSAPPELAVVQVEPQRASIRLESIVTQDFAVEVKLLGKPSGGYTASAAPPQPPTVKVRGPDAWLKRVRRVAATIEVKNVEVSLVQRVELQPLDEEGKRVEGVEIVPANAMVSVNVLPDIVPRMLPVFPTFEGAPPPRVKMTANWKPRLVPVVFEPGKGTDVTALYTKPIPLAGRAPGEHEAIIAIEPPEGGTLVKDKTIQLELSLKLQATARGAQEP